MDSSEELEDGEGQAVNKRIEKESRVPHKKPKKKVPRIHKHGHEVSTSIRDRTKTPGYEKCDDFDSLPGFKNKRKNDEPEEPRDLKRPYPGPSFPLFWKARSNNESTKRTRFEKLKHQVYFKAILMCSCLIIFKCN